MDNDKAILPLRLNGLDGRLLHLEASKASAGDILLIYGLHSSLERMLPVAQFLRRYGHVTLPDLPGIGGMTSFYKIGQAPTLDAYADYLYTVLKTRRLTHKVTVVAMSFGFLVVTRMLQRYPETEGWIKTVISFVGFGSADDFKHIASRRRWQQPLSRLLKTPLASRLTAWLIFNPLSLRLMFKIFELFNPKYQLAKGKDQRASLEMELNLWQKNDARTRFALYDLLFSFDLTRHQAKLRVPLHDMSTRSDQYFDHARVSRSLNKMYEQVQTSHSSLALHAPSLIGTTDEIEKIFTPEAKAILKKV